jgi:hypothetical protein
MSGDPITARLAKVRLIGRILREERILRILSVGHFAGDRALTRSSGW